MSRFSDYLKSLGACRGAVAWSAQFRGAQAAWEACDRGDWMLWLLARRMGDIRGEKHRRLVKLACACVRLALNREADGQGGIGMILQAVEGWADGRLDGTDLVVCRTLPSALHTLTWTPFIPDPADQAACVADVASSAAHARAYAACGARATNRVAFVHEQARTLRRMADLIRQQVPDIRRWRAR